MLQLSSMITLHLYGKEDFAYPNVHFVPYSLPTRRHRPSTSCSGPKTLWHGLSHSRPIRLHPNHHCSHCTGCQCGSASTSRWRSLPTRYRRRRRRRIWIRCCTDTSAHVPYCRPTSRDSSSQEHALNSLDTLFLFLPHPFGTTSLTTFLSVKLFQHSRNI